MCLLHDFRLLCDAARQTAVLIVAEREFGKSFADPRPVTFLYYELTVNKEGIPGIPALYFKASKKLASQAANCDVTEAFEKELGLAGAFTSVQ